MPATPQNPKTDTLDRVVAAMTELGEATAAAIAEQAGLAYPTVTPRLRALETDGRALRSRAEGRTLWRLSAAGTATAGTPQTGAAATTIAGRAKAGKGRAGKTTAGKATSRTAKPAVRAGAGGRTDAPAKAGRSRRTPEPDHRGPAAADRVGHPAAEPAAGQPATSGRGPAARAATATAPRREKGALRAAVLAIMQTHPDRAYKVGELAKLAQASAGAVANALHKLVHDGSARQTVEHPATYQAN